MRTPICERLGCDVPIFAFSHCRDVVAAVCNTGAMGVLGAVGFTVEQLRQVFPELHATTVRDTVSFAWASRAFDEAGEPLDAAGCNAAAQTMLDQLAWWGRVLRNARRADAAASAVVA